MEDQSLSLRQQLFDRLHHWRSIVWGPLVPIVSIPYVLLAFITWARDELVRHPQGTPIWRVVDCLPSWSLSTWIAIGFGLLVIIMLEGSYRHARTTQQRHDANTHYLIASQETAIRDLTARHDETLATLKVEQERNGRSEIQLTIERGAFCRSLRISTINPQTLQHMDIFMLLVFHLVNIRPQLCTISDCRLSLTTSSGNLKASRAGSGVPNELKIPSDACMMEKDLELPHGKGITRSLIFEAIETTQRIDYEPSWLPEDCSVLLRFTVIDSFGQTWQCERHANLSGYGGHLVFS